MITINERTKVGKTLLELAKILYTSNKGAVIEAGLKKPVTTKEKNTYDPKFVAMVHKRTADHKSGKTKSITVNKNHI